MISSQQSEAFWSFLITDRRLLIPDLLVREEREMKTAASRQWAEPILKSDCPDVSKRFDRDA
jgi:hypothetical protein